MPKHIYPDHLLTPYHKTVALNDMIFPPPPNAHALAVLILAVVALVLFTREKIPLESSSLLVLISLAVGFEVFPFHVDGGVLHAVDFFRGFGHEALGAVCTLMIAGQGIVRTGALEPVGRVLARLWKVSPSISLLLTLVVGAFISAFINNVPVVVLLLPILINVSLRTGMKASSALMPMGFATVLGGTCTTIGTFTNLLVVSVAVEIGLKRMGMFDFIIPAAIAGGIGIVYLWLVAPRIIPERELILADTSPRVFSAHLAILAGRTLSGIRFADRYGIITLAIHRAGRHPEKLYDEIGDIRLKDGDILLAQGPREQIAGLKEEADASDGHPHRHRFQQRSSSHWHPHRRFNCRPDGTAGRAVCLGSALRGQYELCHPNGLQDQSAGHECGQLHLQRFPPNWDAAASNNVGDSFLVTSEPLRYNITLAWRNLSATFWGMNTKQNNQPTTRYRQK
jgi:hypothetical protein